MTRSAEQKILAQSTPSEFIGREVQLERLLRLAAASDRRQGFALLATPLTGTSELLRQVFDRLFSDRVETIPFYFQFRQSDRTAHNAARRFLYEFLLQTVAFGRRNRSIIDASPEIDQITLLAAPKDGHWIDRLAETWHSITADGRSSVRSCLSAPLRAAEHGARSLVMLDGLQTAARFDGGTDLVEDLIEIFGRGSVNYVFAGQRRFMFGLTSLESFNVDAFSFNEAGQFIELLSAKTGVAINVQTRDLMAVQFGCRAGHIASLFAAASARGIGLNSFENVQQIYTDQIFGGRIARHYDAIFDRIIPETGDRDRIIKLMSESLNSNGRVPASYWRKHAGMKGERLEFALASLNHEEIINLSSDAVMFDRDDLVAADYIRARASLEINPLPRALAVGEALSANLKRASRLMARHYRRDSAIGLRSLMLAFDGRKVSPTLIDYTRFKAELKGADDKVILKAVTEGDQSFELPHIVYTAHTEAFYSKLNELCDAERSAVALGFTGPNNKHETVWIAAEIESKLEAAKDIVEFWCDRLEMAAVTSNFDQFKIWLIAPEGFTDEAMAVLRDRNAYGSSRKQIDLLTSILNAHVDPAAPTADYEIVIPMGENTEMIAAHTVEEITRRHGFPAKAINQIKTALVEACINASEHSLSPDRRIYQKFAVDSGKITITVSNRGVRLSDKPANQPAVDEGRRGWGLKLIEGLMDELRVEDTDDGTRITMVKYIAAGVD